MGKGKGGTGGQQQNVKKQIDPFSQAAANLARQTFAQTEPLRAGLTGQFGDLLGVPQSQPAQQQPLQAIPFNPATQQAAPLTAGEIAGQKLFGATGAPQQQFVPGVPVTQQLASNLPQDPGTGVADLSNVQDTFQEFLPGGVDVNLPDVLSNANTLTIDPAFNENFGALKSAQERQFDLARERTIDTGATGGALTGALTQLEGDRAFGLSQLLADLANQQTQASNLGLDRAFNVEGTNAARNIGLAGAQIDINQRNIDRALQIASGGTANALGGFSVGGNLAASSAATQAGLANAQANRDAGAKQGLGQGIGTIIGAGKLAGCWVAREVMPDKWRLFRRWLFRGAPDWLTVVYCRYGARLARYITDKPKIKHVIRFGMNRAIAGGA